VTTAPTLFDTTTPAAPAAAGLRPLVVVALDVSLTCTGVAGAGWTDRIRTKLRGDERLAYLETEIASFIRAADMVAMEGPSYGHSGPRFHEDLAGLRVLVRRYCHRHDIPYALVPPSNLKLYVTGRGNAAKGEVRSAIADRYDVHTEGVGRYDMADAYGALAAASDWLGQPLASVPDKNRGALAGCQWPEREAVTAR
jgi:Holliday junction resolvasome RuvABC endonuclease subunit